MTNLLKIVFAFKLNIIHTTQILFLDDDDS